MRVSRTRLGLALLSAASIFTPSVLQAAEGRTIEEVVVTAERKESSVQDTSISITAFTSDMMDEFGIRNQSDLQNMVPATTIQPYDSAIRGVGRNFRNLGGDPGVATYMNGIYSEDLYTATIGSFWDVDRIEVLRGPQGTLYGRNAVGGAMNFLYKKPTDALEFSVKSILGDYGTQDFYAMVNTPLIEDVLNGRLVASSREHDGWIEERSGLGDDLDSGDETNIALSLEFLINDSMTFNIRQNIAEVDRVMGGAAGGGLIVLSGESPGDGTSRNFTSNNHSLRVVDPTVVNPTLDNFLVPGAETFNFTNPTTGAAIIAQRTRTGVDGGEFERNSGRSTTYSNTDCVFSDKENIDGGDLCAYTNGLNNETFDQKGTQTEFSWEINDSLTFKYLFGYNALMYKRTTDDDNTASLVDDRQFFVNHEAEYTSHEFQLFWDVSDTLSFTSGVFFYDSVIDQRYDFYSSTSQGNLSDPTYALDNILATVASGAVPGDPPLTFLFAGANDFNGDSVPDFGGPVNVNTAKTISQQFGVPTGDATLVLGPWLGDATLGSVPHGPETPGSDTHVLNKTSREAIAIYTQGVWDINDDFTLTFGLRWAEDDVEGEEQLAQYGETELLWAAPDPLDPTDAGGPFFGALSLLAANVVRGAINPATLQPTGLVEPWLGGVPLTVGLYRASERVDSEVTWRINLDYNLSDDSLLYGNVTTGYRSGGFNLAFFSETPQYEPEELIAYEVGLKAQYFDNSLQMNASVYLYDYESIHTFTTEACPPVEPAGGYQSACILADSTSSVQAAPGAEVSGAELEVLWLATDYLTLGGNFSYTHSEYTESFIVVDGSDPTIRGDIYESADDAQRGRDINGNQLLQVPEIKTSLYASYNFEIGEYGQIDVLGNYSYLDDVYFSAFEDELDLAPAYDRFDVRATWTSPSESWIVSGFVNNVTDEVGIRQILRHGAADGFRRTGQVSEPRLYGVELTYNFLD